MKIGCGDHQTSGGGAKYGKVVEKSGFKVRVEFSVPMVRAAQASPDHGLCGVSARAGDPSCLGLS